LKGESKEEILESIEEMITLLRLLKIKVDSLPEDSDLLPYIAFSLKLGKTATTTLHKKFMVDQMTRIESQSKRNTGLLGK
jgi:hypothetical protein